MRQSILRCEALGVGDDVHVGIEALQPLRGTDGLRHPQHVLAIEHLTVQVGERHHIVVHQCEGAYTGSGKVQRDGRAQTSCTDDKHLGIGKPALPLFSDFRQHGLPMITIFHYSVACSRDVIS